MNADQQKALRADFEASEIGKLPRIYCRACKDNRFKQCDEHKARGNCRDCGQKHSTAAFHLDYVGHAETTDRLLSVDPEWTWEGFGPDGMPVMDAIGGLWIRLTICGVTRLGYGHAGDKTGGDAIKECIGDAIRNGAMRFGVALSLWRKTEKVEQQPDPGPDASPPAEKRASRAKPPVDADAKADADLARSELRAVLESKDIPLTGAVVEFRKRHKSELKDSVDAGAIRALAVEYQEGVAP